jgi:Uncharacterized protein conserved in bacteria (DUF2188)
VDANVKSDESSARRGVAGAVFHVTPGNGGWAVSDTKEGASSVHPNKLAAVSAARQMLRNVKEGHLVVHRKDGRIESEEGTSGGMTYLSRRFRPDFGFFPPPRGETGPSIIQDLSAKTGESQEEVVRKALALYKAATEAVEQGKSVGIASDPSHLEAEFVGF